MKSVISSTAKCFQIYVQWNFSCFAVLPMQNTLKKEMIVKTAETWKQRKFESTSPYVEPYIYYENEWIEICSIVWCKTWTIVVD